MRFTPQELTIADASPFAATWGETFVWAPSNKEEENLGCLFVAAEIFSNKTKKENAALLTELAGVLKNEYYKNTIVTPVSALRFALKRANNFLSAQKKWFEPACALKLKIVAASLKGYQLHLARLGDGAALILRNGDLAHIVPPASTPPLQARAGSNAAQKYSFQHIVSGELAGADKVVLATNQINKIDASELAHKLKSRGLVDYLKTRPDGLKNLSLIVLDQEKQESKAAAVARPDRTYRTNRSYRTYIKPAAIAVALALVLALSAAAAVKIKNGSARERQEAETLVREISEINSKIPVLVEAKNDAEALELLASAREKLSRLAALGYFKTTRATLERDLAQIKQGLDKVEEVSAASRVVELENISDFSPKGLSLGRNKIMIYGVHAKLGGAVYRFDLNRREGRLENVESEVISASDKPENPNAAIFATADGLVEIAPGPPEARLIWSRPEAQPPFSEAEIYSGAFYLLAQDNLIYKLPFEISSTTGEIMVGELALWSKTEATSDKRQVTSFAVGSSIFLLTADNFILELANGEVKDKRELPEKYARIFAGPTQKNIYLLSSEDGLVAVFNKNLEPQKKFSHPELKGAESLAVDSQERTVYFLKGKTVYSFEI